MDISNKNPFRQRICILLVLTLCTGLCAGVDTRLSKITLSEGESHDIGDGYSITVTEIDLRGNKATFELITDGRSVDSTTVYRGEGFTLSGLENFYFEATLDVIFVGTETTLVQLIGSESGYPAETGGEDA